MDSLDEVRDIVLAADHLVIVMFLIAALVEMVAADPVADGVEEPVAAPDAPDAAFTAESSDPCSKVALLGSPEIVIVKGEMRGGAANRDGPFVRVVRRCRELLCWCKRRGRRSIQDWPVDGETPHSFVRHPEP